MSFIKNSILGKSQGSGNIDMKRFLTDNYYVGTEDYYRDKTNNSLPDHIYPLLELQARETDEQVIEETVKDLKERYLGVFKIIMDDLAEREREGKENLSNVDVKTEDEQGQEATDDVPNDITTSSVST